MYTVYRKKTTTTIDQKTGEKVVQEKEHTYKGRGRFPLYLLDILLVAASVGVLIDDSRGWNHFSTYLAIGALIYVGCYWGVYIRDTIESRSS